MVNTNPFHRGELLGPRTVVVEYTLGEEDVKIAHEECNAYGHQQKGSSFRTCTGHTQLRTNFTPGHTATQDLVIMLLYSATLSHNRMSNPPLCYERFPRNGPMLVRKHRHLATHAKLCHMPLSGMMRRKTGRERQRSVHGTGHLSETEGGTDARLSRRRIRKREDLRSLVALYVHVHNLVS
jgi:hypothetical protein